jgi:hypothetical protein
LNEVVVTAEVVSVVEVVAVMVAVDQDKVGLTSNFHLLTTPAAARTRTKQPSPFESNAFKSSLI